MCESYGFFHTCLQGQACAPPGFGALLYTVFNTNRG